MRIALISPRAPRFDGRGDQGRALDHVTLLTEAGHEVVVVTTEPWRPAAEAGPPVELETVPCSVRHRVAGAALALVRGRPAQCGWSMPVHASRRAAEVAEGADVAIAVTIRALGSPLGVPTLLDHVDAMSLNFRIRAGTSLSPLARLAWIIESILLQRHEHRSAGWVSAAMVTSATDARQLPREPPVVISPIRMRAEVLVAHQAHPRPIDMIFTGDMGYPPNRAAAYEFIRRIVPRVRSVRPTARVVVAGRGARGLRGKAVELLDEVPDMHDLLTRSKVAVVPLRRPTGTPNKLVEAYAAGCAVATYRQVAERLGTHSDIVDEQALAAYTLRLLEDFDARVENSVAGQLVVQNFRGDEVLDIVEGLAGSPNVTGVPE